MVTSVFLWPQAIVAETPTHIIVSGESNDTVAFEISKYRVKITPEKLAIENKFDDNKEVQSWSFGDYHRFEIGNYSTTNVSVNLVDSNSITYKQSTKSLSVNTHSECDITLSLYNLYGTMLINQQIQSNENVSVAELPKGVYIAIANTPTLHLRLKFIIK